VPFVQELPDWWTTYTKLPELARHELARVLDMLKKVITAWTAPAGAGVVEEPMALHETKMESLMSTCGTSTKRAAPWGATSGAETKRTNLESEIETQSPDIKCKRSRQVKTVEQSARPREQRKATIMTFLRRNLFVSFRIDPQPEIMN
jgi:hypothetical protein